jgi:transcriptional regulator with XRE-family HTH domain
MDWTGIINTLLEKGLSQAQIARSVGLTPPSIIDLTSGRQRSVKWEVGDALLKLHAEHCAEQPQSAAPTAA